MDNTKRVALYARVSTTDQTCENQLLDLRRFARDRGWSVVEEYVDTGISGVTDHRPALDRLLDAARKRQFDILLVWKFDRLFRSLRHLVNTLEDLKSLRIGFVSFQENIDLDSPLGLALFAIIGAMVQLERDVIRERIHAGLRRARKSGKALGRPRIEINPETLRTFRSMGWSIRQIAAHLSISKSLVAVLLHRGIAPEGPKAVATPITDLSS